MSISTSSYPFRIFWLSTFDISEFAHKDFSNEDTALIEDNVGEVTVIGS